MQSHSFTSNSDLVAATSPPMAMTPPPAWQRDEEANECGLCDRKFTLFIRRHHCRWCGKVYCANCTTARIPIPTSSSSDNSTLQSEQRVCDTCHGLLTGISSPLHRLRVQSSVAEHKTPLLSPSAASSPRHESSPLESSIMNECPVCGDALSMNQAEAEFHLNQCINNQGAASVSAISGKRYVVTIVEPGLFSSASNSMRDVKGKMNAVASSAALAAAAIDTPHHSSDDSSDTEVIGSTSTQPAATAFSIEFDCSNNSRSSTTRVKFSNSISATIETNEIPPYQPREGDMNSSPRSDSSSPLPSPPPQSSFSDGGIIHECVIVS